MKKPILYALLFSCFNTLVFAQVKVKTDSITNDSTKVAKKVIVKPVLPKVFLNEKSEAISEIEFNVKCGSASFYCKQFEKPDMTVFKVYYKMFFGKLKPKEYEQVRIYLNNRSNKKVPENHKILIHYEESLYGFDERNEHCNLVNSFTLQENFEAYNNEAKRTGDYEFTSIPEFHKYVRIHEKEYHDKAKFDREVEEYADQQNACIKKIEKKHQTPVFYIVSENFNYPIKNKYFSWVVDTGVIRSGFLKNHPDADFVLIKPNGEFFVKTGEMPDFVLNKLLKKEDWLPLQKEWFSSMNTNDPVGFGIVKDMTQEYEFFTPSCY